DAGIRGPPVHADVRIAAGRARFARDELRGDLAALTMRYRVLSETPPLVTEAPEVSARVVPRRDERRHVENGQLPLTGVRPDLPREVSVTSRAVVHLQHAATRHRSVAIGLTDGRRATRSAAGATRGSTGGASRLATGIAAEGIAAPASAATGLESATGLPTITIAARSSRTGEASSRTACTRGTAPGAACSIAAAGAGAPHCIGSTGCVPAGAAPAAASAGETTHSGARRAAHARRASVSRSESAT